MDDIELKLLNYDALSSTERAEAEAHLAAHPEASALVDEGRALRGLLEQAARAGADVPDAEAVAQYVAAQHMAHQPLPPDLAALGERVEAAFAAHPEVERHYSIMRDRLYALTAEAESPRAQFERLTGTRLKSNRLRSRRLTDGPRENDLPDDELAEVPPVRPAQPAPDRRPQSWRATVRASTSVPFLHRYSPARLALAASVLLAMLYGGLFLAGGAAQTKLQRLANLDDVPAAYEGLRLRGMDGAMDPTAERYAAALDHLNAARSTTLGLFPRYDAARLDTTLHLLHEVTEFDEPSGALGLEAWFLIGKVLLHQGAVEPAREAFLIVVERQGPSAPDAQRLLDATASPRAG